MEGEGDTLQHLSVYLAITSPHVKQVGICAISSDGTKLKSSAYTHHPPSNVRMRTRMHTHTTPYPTQKTHVVISMVKWLSVCDFSKSLTEGTW